MEKKIRSYFSDLKSYISAPKQFRLFSKFKKFTMFEKNSFINNLKLAETLKKEGVVVECGTWRGGMIAGIASVLGPSREYFLYDSFEGLPDATEKDGNKAKEYQDKTRADPEFGWDNCKAEMQYAKEAMEKSGVTNFKLIKGWFNETVSHFDKTKSIALLHLDGDWYDSIMVCLENLYDCVVSGGIIIIDDYTNWDGCTRAVHDFLSQRDIPDKIRQFNNQISYIIKT